MGGISTFETPIFELRMDLNKANCYFCAEIVTNSLMIMSYSYSDKSSVRNRARHQIKGV
jgi:hypothetical protein